MPKLSIIILSYNTRDITLKCLDSVFKSINTNNIEVIVIDNGSQDGSKEILQGKSNLKIILNEKNLGYSKGNNQGIKAAQGEYILFLNSDVIIDQIDFNQLINYFDYHPKVGVLTVKVLLPNGKIDLASHRGFPTIWNSICYFAGLENFFKYIPLLNKFFGGYHLNDRLINSIHEIDSPSGAFYFTRKSLLNKLKGFDEHFFMYGEDLDLSYRLKKLGYSIIYYPLYSVIHLKYVSGLKTNIKSTKKQTKKYFFQAMKIFYDKHYQKNYPNFINSIVHFFIDLINKLS